MWIKILCIEYILRGIPTIESTFDVANMVKTATVKDGPINNDALLNIQAHKKKIGHRDCSPWPKWSQPAVTELWPSHDWALIILKMPWLSCDLAVTSPSRDWAMIIGPGAVTTVSARWQFFSHGGLLDLCLGKWYVLPYLVVPLISARVPLISTRVSAHCQAILLDQPFLRYGK